jgi:hypothetical protein
VRRPVRRLVLLCAATGIAGSVLGAVLVARSEGVVDPISRTSDATTLELVGVLVAVAAWLPALALCRWQWRAIDPASVTVAVLATLAGIAVTVVVVGYPGTRLLWITGEAILVAAQVPCLAAVWHWGPRAAE